jgi:hypothetical protein
MSLGDRFHKMRANVGQISPGVNTNTNNYNEDELIDINKSMIGVRNTKKNIIL